MCSDRFTGEGVFKADRTVEDYVHMYHTSFSMPAEELVAWILTATADAGLISPKIWTLRIPDDIRQQVKVLIQLCCLVLLAFLGECVGSKLLSLTGELWTVLDKKGAALSQQLAIGDLLCAPHGAAPTSWCAQGPNIPNAVVRKCVDEMHPCRLCI